MQWGGLVQHPRLDLGVGWLRQVDESSLRIAGITMIDRLSIVDQSGDSSVDGAALAAACRHHDRSSQRSAHTLISMRNSITLARSLKASGRRLSIVYGNDITCAADGVGLGLQLRRSGCSGIRLGRPSDGGRL